MKTTDLTMGTIYRAKETYSNSAFYLLPGRAARMAIIGGPEPVATTDRANGARLAIIASNVADIRAHEDELAKLSVEDFIGESMDSKLLPGGLFLTSISPAVIAEPYAAYEEGEVIRRRIREHALHEKERARAIAEARHAEFVERLAAVDLNDGNLTVHPGSDTVTISVETLRRLLPEV